MTHKNDIIVYQAKNGGIKLRGDLTTETVWANLDQIALLFGRDKSVVSRHIKNIFRDGELKRKRTVAFFATVQREGKREVSRDIEYFNLDVILSVGYRVNSKTATKFRQWATKTLHAYVIDGYAINPSQIKKNHQAFLKAVEDVRKLLPENSDIGQGETIDLIKIFANTWFSLDAYDKSALPKSGLQKKQVEFTAEELVKNLADLKRNLIKKREATDLFAQEKQAGSLAGIVGSIFQSAFGKDAYPTLEEKATHLLYFIIKNHPFNDGNKRSGAFAFIWFLKKANLLNINHLSPEALTALTLLIAESAPKEKERMVGLVLLLLRKGEF